jgi:hypothetical protein
MSKKAILEAQISSWDDEIYRLFAVKNAQDTQFSREYIAEAVHDEEKKLRNEQLRLEKDVRIEENKNIRRRNILRKIAKEKLAKGTNLPQDETIIDLASAIRARAKDGEAPGMSEINIATTAVINALSAKVKKNSYTASAIAALAKYQELQSVVDKFLAESPAEAPAGEQIAAQRKLAEKLKDIITRDMAALKNNIGDGFRSDDEGEISLFTALDRTARTERINLSKKDRPKILGDAASRRLMFQRNKKDVFFTEEEILKTPDDVEKEIAKTMVGTSYDYNSSKKTTSTANAKGKKKGQLVTPDKGPSGSLTLGEKLEKIRAANDGYLLDEVNAKSWIDNALQENEDETEKYKEDFYSKLLRKLKMSERFTFDEYEKKVLSNDITRIAKARYAAKVKQSNGIDVGSNVAVRNALSSRVAELLGVGHLIARSTTAEVTFEGKTLRGNLMEKAEGESLADRKKKYKKLLYEEGAESRRAEKEYADAYKKYQKDEKDKENAIRNACIDEVYKQREKTYLESKKLAKKPRGKFSKKELATLAVFEQNTREDILHSNAVNAYMAEHYKKSPFVGPDSVDADYTESNKINPQNFDYSSGELQRQLVCLQMLDTLCLQVDRHAGNYFLKAAEDNPQKIVSITGIDGDLSFVPVDIISSKVSYHLPVFLVDDKISLPVLDKEMSETIISLTPEMLLLAVGDILKASEKDALVSRFTQMKTAIQNLMATKPERFLEANQWGADSMNKLNEDRNDNINYYRNMRLFAARN